MSARQRNARSSTCVPIDSVREAATIKEVETYLLALSSYPDQLLRHRGLTFAQHLQNLIHQEENEVTASRYGT
jgi:hypothetical protein